MEITEIRRSRLRRDKARRRRALILGTITAFVLLILTTGIFGIVFESRSVATESNRLNVFSELVRATTVGRAQLGFAVALDEVNGEVDTTDAISVALDDAEQSLAGLQTSVLILETELDGLDDEATSAFADFVDAGSAVIDAIRSGEPVPPQTIADFEIAYDDARNVAVAHRSDALDELQSADNGLSRLGALVSFTIAFVVPSIAVAIYRMLSRPPRDLLETEARLVRDGVRSALRRDLILSELNDLKLAIAEGPVTDLTPGAATQWVDDFERTFRTLDHAQRCDFQAVDVASVIEQAADDANRQQEEIRIVTNVRGSTSSWSEPEVLRLLLASIIRDCQGRSAKTISISANVGAENTVVRVIHDGQLRSPAELTLIAEQQTTSGRLTLLGSNDVGLLTALHLADDLRGSIVVEEEAGRQVMVLALPLVPASMAVGK